MKVININPPESTITIEILASELEIYLRALDHEIIFKIDKFNRSKATLELGDIDEEEKQATIKDHKKNIQALWRLKNETADAIPL